MNGARVIDRGKYKKIHGSTTVEAAIVLPVFLMVVFSFAYLIRICYAYNMVQESLSNVARGIANMSYFYHVSGAKDYADELKDMADEAQNTLQEQKKTIINAFDSFNELINGVSEIGSTFSVDKLIDDFNDAGDAADGLTKLADSISGDPKAELDLLMTAFGQKLSYELTNKLVCLIAKHDLSNELLNMLGKSKGEDAASALGIKDGINGMSFDGSSVFGDKESLEFVVRYRVKPPVVFGLVPEVKLCNRVKVIAWTGGRGASVKGSGDEDGSSDDAKDESIWDSMDKDKNYMDRGLAVEKLYIGELKQKNNKSGVKTFEASRYSGIDAFTYDEETKTAQYYDIFTLNPFMKTYSQRPDAIVSEIKKHAKRLLDCNDPEELEGVKVKSVKRIVVLVVPENSDAVVDNAFEKAQKELGSHGVEIELVKGYGNFTPPEENEEQDNVA